MAQNETKIKLSKKQREVAELLANPDEFSNHSEIMRRVGVPRTTFYRWLRDENFMKYVSDLVDKYTDAELPTVWKALIKRCAAGDTFAMRLYFELKEKYTPKLKLTGEASVQIFNDIPKTEPLKSLDETEDKNS